jgi:very-short-patch-repair endonuclease
MGKRVSLDLFLERMKSREDVEYVSGFKNMNTKIKVKCLTCNNIWEVTPHMLFRPRYCPLCSNLKRAKHLRDYHHKENYLENLLINGLDNPEEYTWLDSYSGNNKDKHTIRHNICNNEYLVRPNCFQQGYRCPKCSLSKNESKATKEIIKLLKEYQIEFEQEYFIEGYKFDFKIGRLLLEIDGEQHFRESRWNKNGIVRKRDLRKNQLAQDYNFRLIRIPYLKRSEVKEVVNIIRNIIENDFKNLHTICKDNNLFYIYKNKKHEYKILNESFYYDYNDSKFDGFKKIT